MAKLLYQGHGSCRLTTDDGVVVYIDPYAGEGYDVDADIILVTHQHGDHNKIDIVPKKRRCYIIQNDEALIDGEYHHFIVNGVKIQAVQAYNKNHDISKCVGYVLETDGIKIYFAGDTSKTDEMTDLGLIGLDYALLPIDGKYNMNSEEGAECSEIINAKHTIPYHMLPGGLFDMEIAKAFKGKNKLIVSNGEEIELK
jgi:Predicted Zn-dependent hydrolases of the beta-lactamase fold